MQCAGARIKLTLYFVVLDVRNEEFDVQTVSTPGLRQLCTCQRQEPRHDPLLETNSYQQRWQHHIKTQKKRFWVKILILEKKHTDGMHVIKEVGMCKPCTIKQTAGTVCYRSTWSILLNRQVHWVTQISISLFNAVQSLVSLTNRKT